MSIEVLKLDEKITVELTPEQLHQLQKLVELEENHLSKENEYEERKRIIILFSFIVITCQNYVG